MSTANALPTQSDEAGSLTREEWWNLFDQLRIAQQDAYAEVGGPEAFLRQERDASVPSV